MIGFWGFMEELSFVVFPLVLLLALTVYICRTPKRGGGFSAKGSIALVVLIGMPVVFGWKFMREVRAHIFLTSLNINEVESFSIGTQQVTDREKQSKLIHALREIEWFAPHHGGWSAPVDFRVKLRSGEEKYFRIAMYLREPGAIIEFASPTGQGGLHTGYAFSKALPDALGKIGIDIHSR